MCITLIVFTELHTEMVEQFLFVPDTEMVEQSLSVPDTEINGRTILICS